MEVGVCEVIDTVEIHDSLAKKKSFVVTKEDRSLVMDVLANKGVAYPHITDVPGVHQYTNSKEGMRRRLQPFFRKYKDEFDWFLVDTDEKTFVWNIDSELKNNQKIRMKTLGVDVGKAVVLAFVIVGLIWLLFFFGDKFNNYIGTLG